jgi:Ankyrin repeats (3 copies)
MKRSFNDIRNLPGSIAEIDHSNNGRGSDSEGNSGEYISSSEYSSDVDYYRHSDLPMDNNFNTELHYAAREGDSLKCAELLENHPNAATDTNDLSLIPLDLAAMGGHFDACKILLDYMDGEDIYAERACGHTTLELILMEAVLNENHYKVFETLINNLSNTQLLPPISFSVLLYLAASAGCKRLCEVLLTKYPETIEKKNYSCVSPIQVAATNKFPETVELLISYMSRQDIIDTLYSEKSLTDLQVILLIVARSFWSV